MVTIRVEVPDPLYLLFSAVYRNDGKRKNEAIAEAMRLYLREHRENAEKLMQELSKLPDKKEAIDA